MSTLFGNHADYDSPNFRLQTYAAAVRVLPDTYWGDRDVMDAVTQHRQQHYAVLEPQQAEADGGIVRAVMQTRPQVGDCSRSCNGSTVEHQFPADAVPLRLLEQSLGGALTAAELLREVQVLNRSMYAVGVCIALSVWSAVLQLLFFASIFGLERIDKRAAVVAPYVVAIVVLFLYQMHCVVLLTFGPHYGFLYAVAAAQRRLLRSHRCLFVLTQHIRHQPEHQRVLADPNLASYHRNAAAGASSSNTDEAPLYAEITIYSGPAIAHYCEAALERQCDCERFALDPWRGRGHEPMQGECRNAVCTPPYLLLTRPFFFELWLIQWVTRRTGPQ